jgi:hypothetical protein
MLRLTPLPQYMQRTTSFITALALKGASIAESIDTIAVAFAEDPA